MGASKDTAAMTVATLRAGDVDSVVGGIVAEGHEGDGVHPFEIILTDSGTGTVTASCP